jgi:multimeric flavodoxin WrbA
VTVLVIDGSRRPRSNTGAIARDLATRIVAAGRAAEVWRVPGWRAGPEATGEALEKLAGAADVVLVAPTYLDELPAVTQRLLEDVWERRAELHGHAPRLYGIAHSGFPEPIQRCAELRSMRFFAEQMGWIWMGGVGFGGTSPIDGRPLEQAGMFSRQLRKVLPLAVADIAVGRPFSPETVRRSEKSPFPLPRKALIALVNSRTRKLAREKQLDLDAQAYATRDRA